MTRYLVCLYLLFIGRSANAQPALIPHPQTLTWSTGRFDLNTCRALVLTDTSLRREGVRLQQQLGKRLTTTKSTTQPHIELQLGTVAAPHYREEAYQLTVTPSLIRITANTAHGIFNGIQTLVQLAEKGTVPACVITDYPAFHWRGYMVDVGRNYQSIALLKQQIDIMSRYKLNVFHFHCTEDIAWRLQVKQFPQLTDSTHMLRNKGKYYSVSDMQELIQYCKDRYITLVPEIDMPGHSAAFKRAMGVDMQSSEGLKLVQEILREVCTTYDVPFIHIGADEVAIKNNEFLPSVTALIRSYNKQVIGWAPGGNYDHTVIRQLWKDEGEEDIRQPGVRYIDSRSLYLSDLDPLNAVVSLYKRQPGEQTLGSEQVMGSEICLWSDRRVAREADLIRTNPVYPAMLAFGERMWRGGGYAPISFMIGEAGEDFAEFEKRLIEHQRKYFGALPFQYVQQTNIHWLLRNRNKSMPATGGTIWLWHTHSPAVKAWLPAFDSTTTWYAYADFESDSDTMVDFWIDIKDQSRSGADATPPAGEWDYNKAEIRLNDKRVPAPEWAFPGRRSGLLEEPLVDEGFYYRPPVSMPVKKGMNHVVIKLPAPGWSHADWQSPPKYMFTFIPVRQVGRQFYVDERMRFRKQ